MPCHFIRWYVSGVRWQTADLHGQMSLRSFFRLSVGIHCNERDLVCGMMLMSMHYVQLPQLPMNVDPLYPLIGSHAERRLTFN